MKIIIITIFAITVTTWGTAAQEAELNIEGGLIVCIGSDALESIAGDWKKPGRIIHCLTTAHDDVAGLRAKIRSAGCYGTVSVTRFDGRRLPYINNLVNLLIAGSDSTVPESEVKRVLAPYGTAMLKGKKITKPYPKEMDEWPQYLHGADNNCVARDTVAGPPRHVQWISGPAWTRAHIGAATISSMVSSGGRLFTIEDTETAENPLLPARWKLIARNAFNGVVLWTLEYPTWEQLTVYIKNYHAQMQRRLAAIGDTVYCTPGLTAPLTALDGATGKTLMQYKGTEGTKEFAYHEGRLYAVIGDRMHFNSYRGAMAGDKAGKQGKKRKGKNTASKTAKPAAKRSNTAFKGDGFPLSLYNPQTHNAANPSCEIAAIDAKTGKEIWRSETITYYTGCSMALKGDTLVYQSTQGVFCLNARTGGKNWEVKKDIPYGRGNSPNTLVLSDDAVYSEEGRRVFAYSLADGRDYWGKSIKARKGYQASTDLLIAAGALWMCGNCNNPKGTVLQKPTAYDLKTGNEIKTINQQLSKPMGHDRCFRNFITERFFINSKTGGPDCMDLKTDAEYPAPFMRATCSMGHLPCNGLIYCGPYACQCHLPVGLHNFNAYYTNEASLPTRGQVVEIKRSVRLEKGPAYGWIGTSTDTPWPTFRQDARRYAGTNAKVPAAGLQRLWKAGFTSKVSAPVIAEGTLFVAETDAHTLHALDADTGKAMALAGDVVFVAGAPLLFRLPDPAAAYKGRLGGELWAVSAADGSRLAKYNLDVLPAWEGMAAAYGRLFIVNQDGSIHCLGTAGAP